MMRNGINLSPSSKPPAVQHSPRATCSTRRRIVLWGGQSPQAPWSRMRKSMLRRMFVCAFAALFTLTVAHAREPRLAAQIPIPLPDGKKITLQQYRGKVVLLAIFSTMCPDCIDNIEMLNRVQKELGPKGFQAIGGVGDED